MSDDLVKWLRGWDHCWPSPGLERAVAKAADRIVTLAAERDRLREALTPNEATKEAYMGEFYFSQTMIGDDGNDVTVKTSVPWTTVKEIMAAILARAALKGETNE